MTEQAADQKTERVLVLGHDARMVLPIVRSLGRRGIAVHVAWCPEDSPALRSRYISQRHVVPTHSSSNRDWLDALTELCDAHDFDLIIPATEDAVVALHFERSAFRHIGRVALPPSACFEVAFDKVRTTELARELGIPVPQSVVAKTSGELDAALAAFSSQAVVKPASSLRQQDLSRKRFVRTDGQVAAATESVSPDEPMLVQSWVAGRGVGVEFIACDGETLLAFQHDRLHETTGHGSTYRRSVPLTPHLQDAAEQLIRALNYTGVGMVEFRVDDETGNWVLLEINGRFWGSLPLAVAAGADFPWYLYQLLVKDTRDFAANYRTMVRCRSFRSDLRWMWRSLRGRSDSKDGWGQNSIGRWRWSCDLVRLVTARDHIDSFSLDDPRPAVHEAWQLCQSVLRHAWRGVHRRVMFRTSTASNHGVRVAKLVK